MRPGLIWNYEHIARLERGIAAKESYRTIAADLGRSKDAVRHKAVELGLRSSHSPPSFWTAELAAEFRQCLAVSKSYAEAGAKVGCNKNMAISKARRLGISEDAPMARKPKYEPTTTMQRLDVIHARMDALLAETRPFVEDRPKVLVPVDEQRAAA